MPFPAVFQWLQDAVVGGEKTLEKELAASLQVISKLECDINASRAQTDNAKLALSTLEKQLENATIRYCSAEFRTRKLKYILFYNTEPVLFLQTLNPKHICYAVIQAVRQRHQDEKAC